MRRFPELGKAWEARGPGRFFPLLAEVLEDLVERGELQIPGIRVAVIQLFALTLYPHLVFSSYGNRIDSETSDALIDSGVDMFLRNYGAKWPRGSRSIRPVDRPSISSDRHWYVGDVAEAPDRQEPSPQ